MISSRINHAYETIRKGHRPGTKPKTSPTPARPPSASSGTNPNVPEPEANALGWYAKAAAEGHADAQCIIATMYAEGQRVPKDESKAIEWFSISSQNGHTDAHTLRQSVASTLSPEQRATAVKLSADLRSRIRQVR